MISRCIVSFQSQSAPTARLARLRLMTADSLRIFLDLFISFFFLFFLSSWQQHVKMLIVIFFFLLHLISPCHNFHFPFIFILVSLKNQRPLRSCHQLKEQNQVQMSDLAIKNQGKMHSKMGAVQLPVCSTSVMPRSSRFQSSQLGSRR